jgi:hypothetical protein
MTTPFADQRGDHRQCDCDCCSPQPCCIDLNYRGECSSPGAFFVWGVSAHGWYLIELAALFLGLAILAALLGRMYVLLMIVLAWAAMVRLQ